MHHFKEIIIAHGWGWFIDIENKSEDIKPIYNDYKKIINNNQNNRIRSYKSLKNLTELENGFNKVNQNDNDKSYQFDYYALIEQTTKVISIIICGIIIHKVILVLIN